MPVIEWSEALQLGDAATDANHAEFCALLNTVADASDADFIAALDAFIAHTEIHFGEENTWMDAAEFPPRHCHRGEHEMELGRRLVAELPEWFAQHVDVMDRMMTTYLTQMGKSAAVV